MPTAGLPGSDPTAASRRVTRRPTGSLPPVRRLLVGVIIGVVGIVLLSGCGSRTPAAARAPLTTALSFFPAQSPVVATLQTSSRSPASRSLQALERRFPFLTVAKTAALAQLGKLGIDENRDLKPLFGNPIVVGSTGGSLSGLRSGLLLAWVTHSAAAVTHLLHLVHGIRADGTHDGATLYATPTLGEIAVHGPTVVLGGSRGTVVAALDRSAHGGGLTPSQASAAIPHTRSTPAFEVFGDLQRVLAGSARARSIPWVAAIRSYGVAFGAASGALNLDFRVTTDPTTLSPTQLPLAAGAASPGLVAGLPIQAAIHDPAQIVDFVLATIRAVSPAQYARIVRELATARRRTGVDVLGLADQLTGDLVIDSDSHTTLLRAGLGHPGTVSAALAKLAGHRDVLGRGSTLEPAGAGTYAIAARGRRSLIAVIGSALIVAIPPRGQAVGAGALAHFAHAPATPLIGASGALVFRIMIAPLVAIAAPTATRSPFARAILGRLGDLTGSVSATPSALTGHLTLGVR